MNKKPQSNSQGNRERPEIMRTPRPMMILKAAAWIAYPWLFALVKVSRCLGDLCGWRKFPFRIESMPPRPMAIYYEHPDWFGPLFAELDARAINYVKLNASCHSFDPR